MDARGGPSSVLERMRAHVDTLDIYSDDPVSPHGILVRDLRALLAVAEAAVDVREADDHTERMRALAALERAVEALDETR